MPPAPGDRGFTDAEVTGEVVRAVVAGVEEFQPEARATGRRALEDHGLADPVAEWYPLEQCLGAVEEVATVVGDDAVRALGEAVPRALGVAASTSDVPAALSRVEALYRDHHRGDAGGYAFRQIGDTDGRMESRTPYPCAFDRGVVEGTATAVAEGYVRLREVGVCRADGAPRCTYEVTW